MCDYEDVCKSHNPMCDADVGEEVPYPECFKPWPRPQNADAVLSNSTDLLNAEIELKAGAVCNFVMAYEKRKYEILDDGGELQSVACFMVDYCQKLRATVI